MEEEPGYNIWIGKDAYDFVKRLCDTYGLEPEEVLLKAMGFYKFAHEKQLEDGR